MIKENANETACVYNDESNLIEIIEILYEISCEQIPGFFIFDEQMESEKENFDKLRKQKEAILKQINIEIISSKDGEENSCTAENFLLKFQNDRLVINYLIFFFLFSFNLINLVHYFWTY